MAKKWYKCNTPKCNGLKDQFEETNVLKQKCTKCKKSGKDQWTETTAPKPVGYKKELDLSLVTVDALMHVFVVDEHQVKHYKTGSTAHGLFHDMEWKAVHKLICHGAEALLTAQKAANLDTPTDGFITITGLEQDHWSAGNGKGTTNTIKIQMGTGGGTFSGHGYPVDNAGFKANPSPFKLTMANGAWSGVELSSTNDLVRKKT